MRFNLLIAILALLLTTSCGSSKDKEKKIIEKKSAQSPEKLYEEALDFMKDKRYDSAIAKFELLERTYPYSKLAIKSQLMSPYSSFKDSEYDSAVVGLNRFIKLNPGNRDIAYAYHLKALSYYEQISSITKDQKKTLLAKQAFEELILRFPTSEYAKEAKFKLDLINDNLAGKEVDVGRFYLKNGNIAGAINRFKQVIDKFDTTSHTPEALHRLVESYIMLGVDSEALKYAAVLGYNHPDSDWYERTYKLVGRKIGKEYLPKN